MNNNNVNTQNKYIYKENNNNKILQNTCKLYGNLILIDNKVSIKH